MIVGPVYGFNQQPEESTIYLTPYIAFAAQSFLPNLPIQIMSHLTISCHSWKKIKTCYEAKVKFYFGVFTSFYFCYPTIVFLFPTEARWMRLCSQHGFSLLMVGIFHSATNGVLTADIEWVTETFILVPPVQYIHIEDCRGCRWWLSE